MLTLHKRWIFQRLEKKILPADIEYFDPIDEIIYKYCNHPSITKINNITKLTERFLFDKVDQIQIEKEILLLNAKKQRGQMIFLQR